MPFVWIAGIVVAAMTAFYMSRQVFLTFFGSSRLPEGVVPHESPETMTIVLRVLAGLAALAGLLNLTLHRGALTRFLEPVFGHEEIQHQVANTPLGLPEIVVAAFITAVSLSGVWLAKRLYLDERSEARRERAKTSLGALRWVVENRFFVDELYGRAIVMPAKAAASFLSGVVDVKVIDGAVNGIGGVVTATAAHLRQLQTGFVRRYVVTMLGGVIVVMTVILTTRAQ